MRILTALAVIAMSHEPARACDFEYESSWAFHPLSQQAARNRDGLVVLPARPMFFTLRGSTVGSDVPTFRRRDGSSIDHSGPTPVVPGGPVQTLRIEVDSGVVLVAYPNSEPEAYVIDPTFVPQTRSTRFETDASGTWMYVDTDAALVRVERANGMVDVYFNKSTFHLSDNVVEVTALFGDGREEVLYVTTPACGTMLAKAEEDRAERSARAQDERLVLWLRLALLLASFAGCIAITRRIRTAGA